MSTPPYRDPIRPIEARIDDLLSRMTPEEKVGQLVQMPGSWTNVEDQCREGRVGSVLSVVGHQTLPLQRAALASRLGIPLVMGIDAIHGHSMWHLATIFPSQLSLSGSFDEDLCRRVARATAVEMAHTGVHWTFSPVCCLPRDLRWGRTDETFGEDPTLIGRLAAAMVRGYQGEDLARFDSVAACPKHYVGYGESEGGRDASDSPHTPRTLRAVFLPPFQAAIAAGAATLMSAYHAIDGVPVIHNHWLLTGVLREEWGWDGMVITDWDTIGRTYRDRHVTESAADCSARALEAGNDMNMVTRRFYEETLDNLASGRLALATVDEACRRVLRLKFRLGLFENPRLADEARAREVSGTPEHRSLALEAAGKSVVLLKNRGLLPLARSEIERIAVIGPGSDDAGMTLGDWALGAGQHQGSREAFPPDATVTVLRGIARVAESGVEVLHGVGCGIPDPKAVWPGPVTFQDHPLGSGRHERAPEKIARAVRLAEQADVVVLVLGDTVAYHGEIKSTATLTLPGDQQALFDAVVATGTPVVVVLLVSKPLAIPEVVRRSDAILLAHNPGMEGGTAIAEILFGDREPMGRLTLSWPHHVGQCPVRYDLCPGAHQVGYPDLPGATGPLFPFGFGLSYTSVRYSDLSVSIPTVRAGESVTATVRVANTGNRVAHELVQVYLCDRKTSVAWPVKQLKDWRRVTLAPGEEQVVSITLPHEALALCDAAGRWVVEPGEFELLVGGSSRDADLLRVGFRVGAA
jgi:beta-glucosidase